jgi:hypothetical protein
VRVEAMGPHEDPFGSRHGPRPSQLSRTGLTFEPNLSIFADKIFHGSGIEAMSSDHGPGSEPNEDGKMVPALYQSARNECSRS